MANAVPETIDEYIASFPPDVQRVLEKIRSTVAQNAPGAREVISYRIPAFKGNGILVFFAAFKNHIGMYPPIRGNAALEKAVAKYAGAKGNLRFPMSEPIPYGLIARIVKLRARQDAEKATKGKESTARKRR
jgi:uncharacterized protein YdhG (YjbR/CyaY superfamily)